MPDECRVSRTSVGRGRLADPLWVEAEFGCTVIGDHAKYIRYDVVNDKIREQLLDLKNDPG